MVIYTLKCCKCGADKRTNNQEYKKKKDGGQLETYVCRQCRKNK